jgi:hypothetical protein
MSTVYEQDFYRWAHEQSELLKTGRFGELDAGHLADEIEGMGKSQKRELLNRLVILLLHLLKWQFQPGLRSRSGQLTVKEQRRRIERHLADNPSLAAELPAVLAEAYELAALGAERETGLPESTFPAACPYAADEVLSPDFLPD